MIQIARAEIKKLNSSKMWILVSLGAVLPVIITCLSVYQQTNLTWQEFIHVAMLCFNVPALLIFSTFAAYLWAREYEENMLEITMCYPYPKHFFLIVKLLLMLLVILLTIGVFVIATIIGGMFVLSVSLELGLLWLFIKIALLLVIMHFMIIPGAFLITILTRHTVAGLIWGIIGMCLCMTLYSTSFIQFLPPCIPFVLADSLLGMEVMQINLNHAIHWSILGGYFLVLSTSSFYFINKRLL